jgi:hypothetical protein
MKTLFKIALALVVIGIVIGIVGLATGGIGSFATTADDYTLVEETYAVGTIAEIELSFVNKRIYVLPSETDEIEIVYYVTEREPVTITETATKLSFIEQYDWNWFQGFNWFGSWNIDPAFTACYVYLPDGGSYTIDATTTNGSLEVNDLDNLDQLDLLSTNGAIDLDTLVVAQGIDVYTTNGSLHISSVTCAGTIDASTTNGTITMDAFTATDIDADTTNGNITITIDAAYEEYRIEMDTTNGKMYIDGVERNDGLYNASASATIDLDTTNGNIRVNFTE